MRNFYKQCEGRNEKEIAIETLREMHKIRVRLGWILFWVFIATIVTLFFRPSIIL